MYTQMSRVMRYRGKFRKSMHGFLFLEAVQPPFKIKEIKEIRSGQKIPKHTLFMCVFQMRLASIISPDMCSNILFAIDSIDRRSLQF